jgi:hypothetical protein
MAKNGEETKVQMPEPVFIWAPCGEEYSFSLEKTFILRSVSA